MTTALENLLVGEVEGVELTQGHLETCVMDTINGMIHLHTSMIMHGDLNIANLMVTPVVADGDEAEWRTKIADFSASRQLKSATDLKDRVLGTPGYRAPEIINGQPCGLPADVFAFGIVAMEILGNGPSYNVAALDNHFGLDKATLAGKIPALLSQARPNGDGPLINLNAQEVIRACLSSAPEDRPYFGRSERVMLRVDAEGQIICPSASTLSTRNVREDFEKILNRPETRKLPVGLDAARELIKTKLEAPATRRPGVPVVRSGTFSRHGSSNGEQQKARV